MLVLLGFLLRPSGAAGLVAEEGVTEEDHWSLAIGLVKTSGTA
jgi:hypothetical protein